MSRISYLVVVLILAVNQIGRADVDNKLQLTVYYESKCSDSRIFIDEQLLPAVGLLHKYLILNLVPFGKADSINKNGRIGFKCQHGPSECRGNLVQDCALEAMKGWSDLDRVAYVACEMDTKAGTVGDMLCVKQAGIPVDVVQECMSTNTGIELQLASEHLTKLIRPKFIPTITIDNIFNQATQDSAMDDLIRTLCSMFKDPKICARHYNDMATVQTSPIEFYY